MKIDDFYDLVIDENIDRLIQIFGDHDISMNTPIEGSISTRTELEKYLNRFSAWFKEENLTIQVINTVDTFVYTAKEFLIQGDNFELPIALIAEFEDNTITSIRDYHSMWPLEKEHKVRKPFMIPSTGLTMADPVERYMKFLEQGDVDSIMELYTEDAYFREPSGSDFKYSGKEELRDLYTKILADGGIVLDHCSAIEVEGTAAVEFIAKKWGTTELPPQAGVAFYDFEGDNLTAARVYDDVEPPL